MALLRCANCGAEAPTTSARFECACGEPLEVEHAFRPLKRELFDARTLASKPPLDSGVWRFREIVYPRFPSEAVVSLREGNTPLYRSRALARWAGIDELALKHEGLNPTGSFKDRGMTVAISRAVANGAQRVACASTGNTAASLAAYAAAAGVPCAVLAPEGRTSRDKLLQAQAYGARVLLVRGSFDRAMELVRDAARSGEVALLNSLNPFRIEGQKSVVLELLQQLAWQPPDWIAFPAGNLGNCAAFGKALSEARYLGLIQRVPRLLAVQADGAAPFARSFEGGFVERIALEPETVASAIRIGVPVSWTRAVRAIRGTAGTVARVTDEEILEAKRAIDRAGIGCEPASAAALAGARKLARNGAIAAGQSVVCVLTGHVLKDSEGSALAHGADAFESVEPDAVRCSLGS